MDGMDWWRDWWAEHGLCALGSRAACTKVSVEASHARLLREGEKQKQMKAAAERRHVYESIWTCQRKGYFMCPIPMRQEREDPDVCGREEDVQVDALLAMLRGDGYNCVKTVFRKTDSDTGYKTARDGFYCDLAKPLPVSESNAV